MNVVHLNASDRRGGAAFAVNRLHRALRARGIDSKLLVLDKQSGDPSVETLTLEPSVARQRAEAVDHVYVQLNRTEISNTHFSLSLTGPDLSNHPAVRGADVIHLHWVASMQTPASLGRLLERGTPVVWTLHDFGPFTGGCHFPAGCRGFEDSCRGCPQLRSDVFGMPEAVLRDKKALWSRDDLTIVAPSHWLAGEAHRSALFGDGVPIEVIPNGIDCTVFRPQPHGDGRAALGLPPAGTYLLCGTDQGIELRKGLEALRVVLDNVVRDSRFVAAGGRLLFLGPLPPAWTDTGWPLTALGPTTDERRVALAYTAADLFLLPSLEDNLPNMMLEALGSGRPVVAFGVGGIPEALRDGWNGRIAGPGDTAAMAEAILGLVADPQQRAEMGENARASVEQNYSASGQAARHVELYAALIERTGARPPRRPGNPDPHDPADPGPAVSALLPDLTMHCLYEAWQVAEADRAARLRVIEAQNRELERWQAGAGWVRRRWNRRP